MNSTQSIAASNWPLANIAKLLVVALLVQFFYWTFFVPNFVRYQSDAELPLIEPIAAFEAKLRSPDAAGLEAAEFAPFEDRLRLLESGYYAARMVLPAVEVEEEGLAILDISPGDHVRFYVNGHLLSARGKASLPQPSYHGLQKRLIPVSTGLIDDGETVIDMVVTIDLSREATIRLPRVAQYGAAQEANIWVDFIRNEWRMISIGVSFVTALLIGLVALRSGRSAAITWLFLLSSGWAIHSLFYRWTYMPFGGEERGLFFALTFMLMSALWPIFIDAWSERPLRYFKQIVLAIFAAASAYVTYWLLIDRGISAFTKVEVANEFVGITLVLITLGRLGWHFATVPDEKRIAEAAIFTLLATLIVFFLFNSLIYDRNVPHLPATQPLLILALVIAFIARRFHLFRSGEEINEMLRGQLEAREAELAEAHAREKLWVREQAFDEERQRIMRDMHDGLGSQLMGMLLAAKRGKIEPSKVSDGLQQVIDEMRLMIDSLDSVGESLGVALSGLRSRLQSRVEDAGFAFEWQDQVGEAKPSFPPRKTLQLFRIIQEAIANSLKHSGGSKVCISLENDPKYADWLVVKVFDDGNGEFAVRPGGHGLDNMQARARQLGGSVEFSPRDDGHGGVVTISLPPGDEA